MARFAPPDDGSSWAAQYRSSLEKSDDHSRLVAAPAEAPGAAAASSSSTPLIARATATLSTADFRSADYVAPTGFPRSDWWIALVPPVIRVSNIRRVFRTLFEQCTPISGFRPYLVLAEILAFEGMSSRLRGFIDVITGCRPMQPASGLTPPWRLCDLDRKTGTTTLALFHMKSNPQQHLLWVIFLIDHRPAHFINHLSDYVFHLLCDAHFGRWLESAVQGLPKGTMYDVDSIFRFILQGWVTSESVNWPRQQQSKCGHQDDWSASLKSFTIDAKQKIIDRNLRESKFIYTRENQKGPAATPEPIGQSG